MRIQLLSDLHLESEVFTPRHVPGADVLVLAGDIDSSWCSFDRFADWSVPVLFLPGNHEFDGRDLRAAESDLRSLCSRLGLIWLHRSMCVLTSKSGLKVRFVGAVRWSDFDTFGVTKRGRAMKAGAYFLRHMHAQIGGAPLDAPAVREEGLICRAWLEEALAMPCGDAWDRTVVVTHFAPSLRSADPRFGHQPSTASFCNADDQLIPLADLWLHGHLHSRSDYRVPRPGRGDARVVCRARGLVRKRETIGWDDSALIDLNEPASQDESLSRQLSAAASREVGT